MVESAFKTTTFWYKFKWNLNSYSQTLTLLFITYTIYPFNVPILCWHQLRSLWATLQYQCDHFLQPQRVVSALKHRKEKQWKRIVINKPHFLLQFILLTYPSSFVDISSVLYEQPYNISVTISCSLNERSVLQNIKRKTMKKKKELATSCNVLFNSKKHLLNSHKIFD